MMDCRWPLSIGSMLTLFLSTLDTTHKLHTYKQLTLTDQNRSTRSVINFDVTTIIVGVDIQYTIHIQCLVHIIHLLQSIASSNFSFQVFFGASFWWGVKRDGTLVPPPGPLFKRLADLDGRAVEVKRDGGISMARVLYSMKTNRIWKWCMRTMSC